MDEAAQGVDCQGEAQELNRLMELEEDITRELLAFRERRGLNRTSVRASCTRNGQTETL